MPNSCRPPKLKGKSLTAAKKKLKQARCALGKVKRPTKVKKGRKLVVKSQSKKGSKVSLVLKAVKK